MALSGNNPLTEDQKKYLAWTLTPRPNKVELQMPLTIAEYAKANKVAERTLRSWKSHPAFKARTDAAKLEEKAARAAYVLPAALEAGETGPVDMNPPAPPESTGNDVEDLANATVALLTGMIRAGDPKAIGEVLKLPTIKAYFDALTAQLNATFEDLSDEELDVKVLEAFTTDELVAEVARREAAE